MLPTWLQAIWLIRNNVRKSKLYKISSKDGTSKLFLVNCSFSRIRSSKKIRLSERDRTNLIYESSNSGLFLLANDAVLDIKSFLTIIRFLMRYSNISLLRIFLTFQIIFFSVYHVMCAWLHMSHCQTFVNPFSIIKINKSFSLGTKTIDVNLFWSFPSPQIFTHFHILNITIHC